MSVLRLLFFVFNTSYFSLAGVMHFMAGLRFDIIACCYGLLPPFLFLILNPWPGKRSLALSAVFSALAGVLFSLVSCVDIIYYRFTLKRMTWDIFRYVSTGNDVLSLVPAFLADYWYTALIWLALSVLFILAVKKLHSLKEESAPGIMRRLLLVSAASVLMVIGLRGGFQLKPLNILDASRFAPAAEASLVLNTPFTLMKTMGREGLERKFYFKSEGDLLSHFNPEFRSSADSLRGKSNVVILIMESLAREYIGYFNAGKGYTPFLDSLMAKSLVVENAYANGRRSIEALPAIFSGIPNLMDEAFTTSAYAGNNIESLPMILRKQGYTSAFFHGGRNGTMGFNSFTSKIGFDRYEGLDEYPHEGDFDGSWGIYDQPYFQHVAGIQRSMAQPFLTAVFSLSAHHPYVLPAGFEEKCPNGSLPIHPMICYSDFALRDYFKTVSNEEWYMNSIFIITADHTAQSIIDAHASPTSIYEIPIVMFNPSKPEGRLLRKAAQQSDITPTIIDALGISSENIFFGKSALDSLEGGFAVSYLSGIYQITDGERCLRFNGQDVVSVTDVNGKALSRQEMKGEKTRKLLDKLKAIIQEYNRRMTENKMKAGV